MKFTAAGVLFGLLLALVYVIGGFSGLVVAVLLGVIGGLVGAHFDGSIDLRAITRGRGRD